MSDENISPSTTSAPPVAQAQTVEAPIPGRHVGLLTNTAVPPGDVGQMRTKLAGSADLVRVEVEAGAEITRILIGKETLFLKAGQTWSDVLGAGKHLAAGTFVILLVQNKTDAAKVLEGAATFANEKADVSSVAQSSEASAPRARAAVPSKAEIPSTSSIVSTSRANARRLTRPTVRHIGKPLGYDGSDPVDVPAASADASSDGVAAVRHMSSAGLDMVDPGPNAHVILMAPGQAHALVQLLTHRVPLFHHFKPTILSRFQSAIEREGAVGVHPGTTEIMVVLPRALLVHLAGVVRGNMGPMPPTSRDAVVQALRDGLSGTRRDSPRAAAGRELPAHKATYNDGSVVDVQAST